MGCCVSDAVLQLDLHYRVADFSLQCQLDLPTRGFSGIFGRSGSGKTTLLRCIAGLTPATGVVRFQHHNWQSERQCLPTYRRPLAFVFQEPRLFPHLDVRGNLQFAQVRAHAHAHPFTFDEAVTWLGLENLLTRKPAQLSGGQQQRVAIARALLVNPQLLLMDEPLSHLDQDSKQEILAYLEILHERLSVPVLYVTHAVDELARLADRVVLLDNGCVAAAGALNDLLTAPALPLAHLDDASAVLDAVVVEHDAPYHLSRVNVAGGFLWVAQTAAALGSRMRVRILARDVSIALQLPQQSSIQNCLSATVVDIHPDRDAARVLVRLAVGNTHLLSRVTRRAVDQLALQPGMSVYAQIKAVALMQ